MKKQTIDSNTEKSPWKKFGGLFKLSFNKRIFVYFFSVFLAFALLIGFFQYKREENYSITKLDNELSTCNLLIYNFFITSNKDINKLSAFIQLFPEKNLRATIVDSTGNVIFDNASHREDFNNHLNRPEIIEATHTGKGTAIRISNSTNITYFYSAIHIGPYFIRTALPYDVNLANMLRADNIFLYFLLVLFAITVVFLIAISNNIGKSITSLRNFAQKAELNAPIKENIQFPDNELGEISSYIVQLYNNLQKTKDKLYIEREKLYKHLQISNEGLAFFSFEKKEILANDNFIQYINIISDKQSIMPEGIFSISEFEPLNIFIEKNLTAKSNKNKTLSESILLNKNGKTFMVKAIIFQDNSFEVSINDITQQEEENLLKRQLTQNIAHELRTPVSSIQGYLETIINNPEIEQYKKHFFIERSYSQAIRLASLVSDISLLNKIDESAILFDCEDIYLLDVIESVFKDIALQIEEKHVNVSIHIDKHIHIQGNHSLLYSIFRNLTDNSLAYAGENFNIILTCFREDDNFYYFSYADTGVGIPDKHLNRLFERFYRIDQGRSRKAGGTGLGLSIVKNAVLFHKGQIVAKNRVEGGLEFIFTLKKLRKNT